jgi:hypothetical protein
MRGGGGDSRHIGGADYRVRRGAGTGAVTLGPLTRARARARAARRTWVGVGMGYGIACAFAAAGTLTCWGAPTPSGSIAAPAGTFTWFGVGRDHACALSTAGAMLCWGNEDATGRVSSTPTGTFLLADVSDGARRACCWAARWLARARARARFCGAVEDANVGRRAGHACAIRSDNVIICWGLNVNGQSVVPSGYSGANVIGFGLGDAFSCILVIDGSVLCWGDNSYAEQTYPVGVKFVQIHSDGFNICGISTTQAAVCWGNMATIAVPPAVPPAGSFVRVSCGEDHNW